MACKESAKPGAVHPPTGSAGRVLSLRGVRCAICLRAQPGQSKTDSDLTWRTWAVRASTAYSYSMAWYMKLTS